MTQHRNDEIAVRLARVIDAALDAVIEIDEQGRVTEFNPAAERMFGYGKADAVGRPLADLIIPESLREAHRAGLARVVATGESRILGRRIELTALRADGSQLPVELSLVVTERPDGDRSFVGFLRDLSARRQAEESLALRAHALDQAQFGIVVSDPATAQITNINQAYARMVGYSPAEIIGSTGAQLVAPSGWAAAAEAVRMLRERGHHTFEIDLLRKDGSTFAVLIATSTVPTPSGSAVRISSVIDISERKRLEQARADAERAVERNTARLEILATASREFASSSGNVDALLALVARRLTEVIGDGCAMRLISPDSPWLAPSLRFDHRDPALREAIERAVAAEPLRPGQALSDRVASSGEAVLIPVVDLERILLLVPPPVRPLLASTGVSSVMAVPLRAHGKTIGAAVMFRAAPDNPYATDDLHFAQELADRAGLAIDNAVLVATLEHRVAERTRALAAANEDLEAFSSSVSHDLRAPLRAIDSFSQALLDDSHDALDDQGKNYLHRIRAATQRMAGLIDDLLTLARVSRARLDTATVDLSALAAEVAAELRQRDPARDTPIHIAPGLATQGDARLLRIVLENLLDNAWKFTVKHPRAEIWFGTDGTTFHVRDTGAGFDMAYADRLFVPFHRLHVSGDYDGTGIGLTIVQRIITHHGGRIWAEAAVDQGATFFFTLSGGAARPTDA